MYAIGPHVSIAGSVALAPERAHALGATAFALFTKNERQWKVKPLEEETITAFAKAVKEYGYTTGQILPHASYLINLGTPDETKWEAALSAFITELERARSLGLMYLNFHPGSALGGKRDNALSAVAKALDEATNQVPGIMPVLENAAGQGTNIGSSFEELRDIIAKTHHPERYGICIDTCHAFAAGYDFVHDYDRIWDQYSTVLGFENLKGLHINDSKGGCGSHIDRHESLGRGEIGMETFHRIAKDPRFAAMPLILETPDPSIWKEEIQELLHV